MPYDQVHWLYDHLEVAYERRNLCYEHPGGIHERLAAFYDHPAVKFLGIWYDVEKHERGFHLDTK
ncbi:hypothetical protein [Sporosarcina cascadiensis]|uniref:hypothetical protein n=1 Tax=Sporosarcina cascadiensis TaxID=2660747 RepID=UPI00189175CE|nr:hypothetical protein [Sporosarcina cascadiensis]